MESPIKDLHALFNETQLALGVALNEHVLAYAKQKGYTAQQMQDNIILLKRLPAELPPFLLEYAKFIDTACDDYQILHYHIYQLPLRDNITIGFQVVVGNGPFEPVKVNDNQSI